MQPQAAGLRGSPPWAFIPGAPPCRTADSLNKSHFPLSPWDPAGPASDKKDVMSTRALPLRPFCSIRLADLRPKLFGWLENLAGFRRGRRRRCQQVFIRLRGRAFRESPRLGRSAAPAKVDRGTRESPGSPPEDGWQPESACARDSAGTREHQWPTLDASARPRSSCEVVARSRISLAGLAALEDRTSLSVASLNRRRLPGARDSRNGEMHRLRKAGLPARFPVSSAPQGPALRGTISCERQQ